MTGLNRTIHQPIRLKVMAALAALERDMKINFTDLRDMLELTDGNLGAHLQRLENEGYVLIDKAFVGKKPRTYLSATDKGRAALEEHVANLRRIIASIPSQ